MKLSPRKQLWWLNAGSPRFVAVGFGLGGLFHCLSILSHDLFTAIFGTAFAGAIGGGFMAKNTNPPGDAWVSAMGYGIGFLIGGCISVPLLFLRLEMGREINFSLPEFYVCFVLGFCIAGAASAAFTRSKLTSVANNTICFLTASGAGGLVVVVCSAHRSVSVTVR